VDRTQTGQRYLPTWWFAAALALALPGVPPAAAQTDPAANDAGLAQKSDVLRRQAHYAEATAIATELLTQRERRLGPDHLDVADALVRLGELQRIQGRYAEAEQLLRRSLTIREARITPTWRAVSPSSAGSSCFSAIMPKA
jgi:tetratricopeptide (TPR) repeat protein